ncbi:MAG: hypothetical protein ACLT98_13795 [Eggerthellaceae bacterium]
MPNCKFAAANGCRHRLRAAGRNVELAQRYRIMQAPTLLSVAADGSVDVIPGATAMFQRQCDESAGDPNRRPVGLKPGRTRHHIRERGISIPAASAQQLRAGSGSALFYAGRCSMGMAKLAGALLRTVSTRFVSRVFPAGGATASSMLACDW